MSKASINQTLSDSVHDRLRAMILCGDLPAGTRLQEHVFAEKLGVSRTPVREAIARLVSEGLVTRVHAGAPTVNKISITEFIEILHVRRLLECEAARQAAIGEEAPDALVSARLQVKSFLENGAPSAAEHADFDEFLHGSIARMSGSTLLTEMVLNLKRKTRIFDKGSIPQRFEPGCHEHIEIIDAILERDPDRASEAMRLHIDNARTAILSHVYRLV